ncbi:MAG TPA: phospholipase D-like domain-containing protein [Thermoanaerobaculia bacterium]|nr:phospholipase D-like domain-containing protein [Thermoanaerobaculia bacterium]
MWPDLVLTVAVFGACAIAVTTALHAILYKRDVRAAIGWAGFIFVAPYVGPLIYLLFGVNRIRRSASSLRGPAMTGDARAGSRPSIAEEHEQLVNHALLGDRVCGNRLVPGNRVETLDGGERAFAAMLAKIDAAARSVSILTYIFDYDRVGRRFVDALAAAKARGVTVRVLVDAVGSRGGRSVAEALAGHGIGMTRFLPPGLPGGILSINLRNHRKLTIIDEEVAFTGGMNISEDYGTGQPVHDVQFEIEGPLVTELHRTFAADWLFATGQRIEPAPQLVPLPAGAAARAVADGPDESFERSRWLILGAIAMARRSIRIVTPYFLPDMSLITALNVAALRGVAVEILIPGTLDHRVVKWASNALLWQVLEKGCRVWFTPPPFDHSKLFTVDGIWTLFGSSNWDARSLRLNFELNVEVLGEELARGAGLLIDQRQRQGREITLAEMDSRRLPVRIRDGLARLFTPYL